jgi:hypothetical protein
VGVELGTQQIVKGGSVLPDPVLDDDHASSGGRGLSNHKSRACHAVDLPHLGYELANTDPWKQSKLRIRPEAYVA